jgi:hypothetical protein
MAWKMTSNPCLSGHLHRKAALLRHERRFVRHLVSFSNFLDDSFPIFYQKQIIALAEFF